MSDLEHLDRSWPLPPVWLSITVAIACILAIFVTPYGYFQFLRLLVTGYAGYVAFLYFRAGPGVAAWLFAFIALIFNPLFVIKMDRAVHAIFDILAAAIILCDLALLRDHFRPKGEAEVMDGIAVDPSFSSANERIEYAKFLARELAMIIGAIILLGLGVAAAVKSGLIET